MADFRVGIDFGGTKIEIVAIANDGTETARHRVANPLEYDASIRAIRELVETTERAQGGAATVGVGIPGAVSPDTGLVKNANSTWLNGRPFARDLSTALQREVRVENDANCFALSEAVDGGGAGNEIVFGVILGTGVGGGITIGGRIVSGRNGNTGEWGHNPLPWPTDDERPGALCYCGRYGCIETFLSGPGMARDHAERHGGPPLDAGTIFARSLAGEPAAAASVARYVGRLARSLATVINLLDPDVIVLGGGLSNVASLYTDVPAIWQRWIFSDVVSTRLAPPAHGDSSGVRGAAWLAGQEEPA